jgi:hypothetical protein
MIWIMGESADSIKKCPGMDGESGPRWVLARKNKNKQANVKFFQSRLPERTAPNGGVCTRMSRNASYVQGDPRVH